MKHFTIPMLDLTVFDESAGGEGAAAAAPATGGSQTPAGADETGTQAGAQTQSAHGRRMKPGERKPPEAAGSDAGSNEKTVAAQDTQTPQTAAAQTATERRAKLEELMKGEYKQEFSEFFNEQFNRRYKEARTVQESLEAQKPIMDAMAALYGIEDGDPKKIMEAVNSDETIWRDKARAAGMTVQDYRKVEQLKAQNKALSEQAERVRGQEAASRQYQAWIQEGEQVKASYPEFDLRSEMGNDLFRRMLTNGFGVKSAYESVHHEELMQRAVADARVAAEKQVVSNIQARGARPAENGTSKAAGIMTSVDVHNLTRQQRRELAKKMIAGADPGF